MRAALAADNLTIAKQVVGATRGEAQKAAYMATYKVVAELATEIDGIAKSFEALKPALEALKKNPDDPLANLAVGRYRCFIKGDWRVGLPLLAKGSDPDLKDAAAKEIAGADTSETQVALGDQWWTLADKMEGLAKRRVRARAAFWYDQALPELSGLSKAKVERRMKQVSAELVKSDAANEKAAGPAAHGKVKKTDLIGGKGGADFEDLPGKHALLVGFDVTFGTWADRPVPWIYSLQPVYAGKDGNFTTKVYGTRQPGNITHVLAKPGYAVSGMTVNAEHIVAGFKVQFMRIRGNKLDPKDSYESEWQGGEWGSQKASIGGDGKPVIGCYGRNSDAIVVIGLLQAE